ALMPAVGSSRHSSCGSVARAMAISRLRCSPCERLAATSSALPAKPTASHTASALSIMSRWGRGWGNKFQPGPRDRAAVRTFSRRERRLLLRDDLEDPMLAILDVEDELAEEGLVIVLAQRLVALREVVSLLELQPFQGLDQLRSVLAAAETGLLHADLEGIHGLEVRLDVAVGQRARWIDLLESGHGVIEEFPVRGRVERRIENRDVAVDAHEPLDLASQRRKVGGLGDGAVARPFVLLGQAEVEGLVADGHAVLAEEDAEQAVEIPGDLRQERRHVGGAERNAGG